jgi:hypothetical protein
LIGRWILTDLVMVVWARQQQMDGRVVDDAIYGIKLELESAGMKAEHSFISGAFCRLKLESIV